MTAAEPTVDEALDLLARLSPQDRLRVVAAVLPSATHDVLSGARAVEPASADAPSGALTDTTHTSTPPTDVSDRVRRFRELHGALKDLNIRISAEDIDEVRREEWRNFPREDIA